MRSCAACMSTSTSPARFCARMCTPCSCASAKPSGCGSSAGKGSAGGIGARAEEPRIERGRLRRHRARAAFAGAPRRARPPRGLRLPNARRALRNEACAAASARQSTPNRSAADTAGCSAVAASARSTAWRTNWWMPPASRKRTSVFCGCTLTSTRRGSSVEPQRVRRLAVVMEHVAIGLAQCVLQHAVADEAAVDERYWPAALRRIRRAHGKSGERARRRRRHRPSPHAGRSRRPAAVRRARAGLRATRRCTTRAVVLQREAGGRMRERDAPERFVAVCPLGGLGAQELAPRRRVEKELFDRDRSSPPPARRARSGSTVPPSTSMRHACGLPSRATRVPGATPRRSTRALRREIPATRSPRDRSPSEIFDVACRATASARSSRSMPAAVVGDADALDAARRRARRRPAWRPASNAFSSNSFNAAAGRSDHLAGGDLVDQQIGQRTDRRSSAQQSHREPSARRRRRPPD